MREEVDPDGQLMKTFVKLSSTIEASLPEEIGVEFLLRDINDSNKSPIHKLLNQKLTSVKALSQRLNEIKTYLQNVIMKRISPSPQIINNIQEIFNFLPNFETEEIIKSLSVQTNNDYLILYMSWMIRSIISLHKLLNNKIMIKEEEKKPIEKKKDENKDEANEFKENKEKTQEIKK
jgi:26S proteasome regulatory subunit N8